MNYVKKSTNILLYPIQHRKIITLVELVRKAIYTEVKCELSHRDILKFKIQIHGAIFYTFLFFRGPSRVV